MHTLHRLFDGRVSYRGAAEITLARTALVPVEVGLATLGTDDLFMRFVAHFLVFNLGILFILCYFLTGQAVGIEPDPDGIEDILSQKIAD